MKKILLFIIAGSLALTAGAQKNIDISEQVVTMSKGDHTGFTMRIENADEKDLVKTLKSWIEEKQKKVSITESGKHEITVNNITVTDLNTLPVNLYFLTSEEKGVVTLTGFFEMAGVYASTATTPDKVEKCRKFMQEFGYRMEKLKISASLATAEKDLDRRNDEQAALEKKNKQLNDQITEAEETIKKAKADLEQNAKDQNAKKEEIKKQEEAIKAIQTDLDQYEKY